ncbi:MAG TPA: PIN domain-containing protein [Thermoanaerobaculia bacterium]|nr:PIN domain-containing protein [Thermoanaerobaculia bacterium]
MRGAVFIDTGAFVAFFNRADRQHSQAKALFDDLPDRTFTSILVVSECYSWFLHKLGEPAARTFRQLLDDLPNLRVLGAGEDHRHAVGAKLDALRGRKLTFVDASSLVLLKEKGISTVWGTDFHLALEGATVRPGPPD